MGVVRSYENVVDRSSSGEIRKASTYRRSFTVRVDSPDTSMVDISKSPGINYGDQHPDDSSCIVTSVETEASNDSMLIFTVSFNYTRPESSEIVGGSAPSEGVDPNGIPDPNKIPEGTFAGSSSLSTTTLATTNSYKSNFGPGVGTVSGQIIRLSNGRPYTSGVDVFYSSEEIKYTNYFFDFQDVLKLNMLINKSNNAVWPVGANAEEYGTLAWKVVSVGWGYRQQSANQSTLRFYEVSITLQRSGLFDFDPDVHILQGWPQDIADLVKNNKVKIPRRIPQIISAGFQYLIENPFLEPGADFLTNLVPIMVPITYLDCDGQPLDPKDLNQDGPNCQQFPAFEQTTEELPLDIEGKVCKPGDEEAKPARIVPWVEDAPLVDFEAFFGPGPPFAPKAGPLP